MKATASAVLLLGAVTFVYAQQNTGDRNAGQTNSRSQSGEQPVANQGPGHSEHQGQAQPAMQVDKNFDKNFVTHAIRDDIFEMKTAQKVAGKVQDNNVKQFAERLEKDHGGKFGLNSLDFIQLEEEDNSVVVEWWPAMSVQAGIKY